MNNKYIEIPEDGPALSEKVRLLLFLVMSFVFFTYCHEVIKMLIVEKKFFDFRVFYTYPHELYSGPANYTQHYSPLTFVIFVPFTYLSFERANFIWFVLNQFALFGCMILSAMIIRKYVKKDLLLAGVICVAFLMNQPLLENIALGQLNLFLYLIVLLSCYLAMEKKQQVLSGALFALILAVKPQLGLLVLFFWWKKNYKFCFATLISYLVIRLISILSFGWHLEVSYWHNLLINTPAAVGTWVNSISLRNNLLRVFSNVWSPSVSNLLYLAISLFLIIITFKKIRRNENQNFMLDFNLVLILNLLVTPHFIETYMFFAVLPFIVAFYYLKPTRTAKVLLVASFCLVMLKYNFTSFKFCDSGLFSIVHAIKLSGLFILWWIYIKAVVRKDDSGEPAQ